MPEQLLRVSGSGSLSVLKIVVGEHHLMCVLMTCDGPAELLWLFPLISLLSVYVCILYIQYTKARLDLYG